jgi:hypothetical protein
MSRQLSRTYLLALAGGVVAAACSKEELPSGSVAYYRSHPAEWERALWVCTNDGSTLEHTIGCANALRLLDESRVAAARQPVMVSWPHSRASVARD